MRTGTNSSSTAPSEAELDSTPESTPKATRKRKTSPKGSVPKRKRPKVTHAATQPAPIVRRAPFTSTSNSKGKQKARSFDSGHESESPDFDGVEARMDSLSSQQAPHATAPAPASAPVPSRRRPLKETARKSTGGVTLSASARLPKSQLAFLEHIAVWFLIPLLLPLESVNRPSKSSSISAPVSTQGS